MITTLTLSEANAIRAALTLYMRLNMNTPDNQPAWLREILRPGDKSTMDLEALCKRLYELRDPPKYLAKLQYDVVKDPHDNSWRVIDHAGNVIAYVPQEGAAKEIADAFNGDKSPLAPTPRPAERDKHSYRVNQAGTGYDVMTPGAEVIAQAPHHMAAERLCEALDQLAAGHKPCNAREVAVWLQKNTANIAIATENDVEELDRVIFATGDNKLVIISKRIPPSTPTLTNDQVQGMHEAGFTPPPHRPA